MPQQVSNVGLVYDTDNASDYQALLGMKLLAGFPEAYPRQTVYGTPEAFSLGLTPVEAVPDVLLQPDQYEDALKQAHDLQILPIYHAQASWRPPEYRYDQDGLGYCWTLRGTGCMMTCRAAEDKELVKLAPVSMGYLVGWRNAGNYLESYIKGAREDGVCPAPDGNMNSTNRSSSYWAQYADKRKLYRLDKVWDTLKSRMPQHCISGLCYGRSGYIAYNWWSHALELLSIRIVNGVWYWDISNSHNDPILTLTGSRAEPDECYFFVSTQVA